MATIAYYIGEHRVLVDEEFLPLMEKRRWYVHNRSKYVVAGIYGGDKYLDQVRLHRVIMNAKEGDIVDHINGDKWDNRRANLRICTNAQNIMNSAPQKKSSSKFKGVCLCRSNGKPNGRIRWLARIRKDGVSKSLGYFDTEEMAAMAYDEAAKIHFGEFAKLNFPEKIEAPVTISASYYQTDFKDMGASKYLGVDLVKNGQKKPWRARLSLGRYKKISLKMHATEEEAARACDKKSWELFKDLSKLNFPEEYEKMM